MHLRNAEYIARISYLEFQNNNEKNVRKCQQATF